MLDNTQSAHVSTAEPLQVMRTLVLLITVATGPKSACACNDCATTLQSLSCDGHSTHLNMLAQHSTSAGTAYWLISRLVQALVDGTRC